ncbi:hypothetical protein MTP09_01625 [Chryseobacterium suipulveris]|uniref:Glycosyltransferase RgtA/B/C/D-like domain-containing protein n=1 Tax=Chryseobacterium suipulveris TaxID=2929800 RepID=A0ABY4BT42_9FLAO|nr:hypothetical protein [Chryseobacterium suipulveris]UOE41372.1 hypothetical protein MTP09_01625 [Chryseobacterium suipulveris]
MEKKLYWNITGILFIVCALFMGWFNYSNFDKGLVMNDEAYYLMHFRDFRDMITIDATNYFRIFQIFYTDNIYHFRIITFALVNLSSWLLFFLAAKYFRLRIHPVLFGFLGVCINFLSWHGTIIVLNQYHGNILLMNLGLSCLILFGMYKKHFLLLISGLFLALIFFDGIPHALAIGPVVLFILINYWKKQRSAIYFFFGGLVLGITFYFTFIQSISSYISQLEYIKIYKHFHRKQHPIRFYAFWFAQVIGFVFVPLAVFITYYHKNVLRKKEMLDKIILIFGGLLIVLSFFFSNLYMLYFFLGLLLYRFFLEPVLLEEKTLVAVLWLVPFGLAFGSGFYFHIRGGMYQIYFFLALNTILLKIYSLRLYLIYLASFLWGVIVYPQFIHEKGWKDFVYTEQTVPVEINGNILYLDAKRKKDIEDLRPYLQNQENVVYSKNNLTGYLYILNAKAPVPYYFTLKDYIKFMMEKQGKTPDDYIYIENDEYPFSISDLNPMKFVKRPENYTKVKAGRFTLYLPEHFQKK